MGPLEKLHLLTQAAAYEPAEDVSLTGTPLPDVFEKFAARPAEPLTLDPAVIDEQRSAWVEAWDQVTLR